MSEATGNWGGAHGPHFTAAADRPLLHTTPLTPAHPHPPFPSPSHPPPPRLGCLSRDRLSSPTTLQLASQKKRRDAQRPISAAPRRDPLMHCPQCRLRSDICSQSHGGLCTAPFDEDDISHPPLATTASQLSGAQFTVAGWQQHASANTSTSQRRHRGMPMPQCSPQRLCWACLSHGRESLTWALAPGHFPLPRPGIWHHTKGSQDSRTYSPTRGISRPLSGGHLPCSGGAAFLSCAPSIKRVLTKSQNGNLGLLVSSPQPTSSAVSPIQSSGLPRSNSKTSRWLAVLRWPLASAQD